MERKPNLFIIGAMKSGTTSLHNYLSFHPRIYMSGVKEPMHFSRQKNYGKGHRKYMKLFAAVVEEDYFGESSTEYAKRPKHRGVAIRLHEFNPDAKLIYVMRDPFDRIISQFKHMVKTNRTTNTLVEELTSDRDYLTNSYYSYQLEPYIDTFGREALFVGLFEEIIDDPSRFCSQVFQWLGIEDLEIGNTERISNSSPKEYKSYDRHTGLGKLFYLIDGHPRIKQYVPAQLINPLKDLLLDQVTYDFRSNSFKADVAYARKLLAPMLRVWIDELRESTGLDFGRWPILQAGTQLTANEQIVADRIRANVEKAIGRSLKGG
ncbi:MAG: sulfotransferase [Planctomycetota bacterium]